MKKIILTSFLLLCFCGTGFSAISDKRMNPFTKKLDYVLPVACGEGEIAKVSSGVWTCSADASSVGGGNSLYVSEASVGVFDNSSADMTVNFGDGFDFSGAGQTRTLSLDYTEDPVNLGSAEVSGVLSIASGGTNSTTASNARTSLGLEIGTNVQAYDADLTTWAGVTPGTGVATFLATPSTANFASAVTGETGSGAVVFGTSPTLSSPTISTPALTLATTSSTTAGRLFRNASHYLQMGNGSSTESFYPAGTMTNGNLCTYDSTGSEIDCNTATSTFQSADSDLTSWADVTRASGFDTFTATPSSANLASLLTDEVGNAGGFTRGTAGSTDDCVKWDASGNLVSAGAACGSGSGGDNVSVNGGSVTDPNFTSTGGTVSFTDSSNTITANVNWTAVPSEAIAEAKINWSDFANDSASGFNWGIVPGATVDYVLKRTSAGVNWQADQTGGGGGAPTDAEYIVSESNGSLSNEVAPSAANQIPNSSSSTAASWTATPTVTDLTVTTEVYDATGWNGDNTVPTKDAVRDKIETISAGSGSTALNLPVYSAKITGSFVEDGDATQGAQIDAGDGNWRLLFDATTDEGAVWQFVMPDNYTGSPALKIKYSMTSATANEVEFEGAIMCVTPGDSADIGTASFSSIAVASDTVPATAGYLDAVTITLNDDSCAAGDQAWIYLSTDADDATNDDATGDREVVGVEFDYA